MEELPRPAGWSGRTKLITYVGVWLLALIVTNPSANYALLVYIFPMGLARVFYPPSLRGDGLVILIACYLIYVVHAVFYFRARRVRSSYIWLAILVALLICNVSACRDMINAH
jgi:hypothetical protein